MNIKRGKSLIAFVLVIAMLLTAIPISNRVMAAENKSIALQFDRYESNNLHFTTTATDLVSAKFYVVDATVIDATGVETKQKVALYATSASTLRTMPAEASYFEKGTTVGKVLIIEEGAILTQAARPGAGQFPTPTEGGNSYTLSEDITIVKNTDGTWKQKKTEALNMEFASSDNDYVYFNTTATDLASAKFYVVDATVVDTTGGVTEQKVALYATSTSALRIMPAQSSYFENGTTAGKAFIIEKGALLEEALRPTGTSNFPVPTVGGSSYILSEDITILKNSSGTWSQKETKALNMEFASSDNDYVYFNTTATDLISAKFYVVDATVVDTTGGVTEQKVALYANGTSTLYIMPTQGSYFENGTTAGKAFIIKEGAILEPAARPGAGLFPTPSWDGNSYTLSEEITIVKNSGGTWSEQVTGNVTLEFASSDADYIYFNTTATDLISAKFYVVDATVVDTTGAETKQKVALYATSTSALRIMPAQSSYFENGTTAGKAFILEKGALLEQAARPTGTTDFPVTTVAGNSYTLTDKIVIVKNSDGTWSEQVTGNVTLEYTEKDASKNFIFRATVDEGVLPRVTNFYLAEASVDGREVQLPMLIQDNGRLAIRETFFTNELGIEVPTTSISFNEGAIFQVADRDASNKIVPVVAGAQYQLTQAFSIKKEEEHDLWYVDVATTNLGDMTMTFEYEDGSDNFYFVGEFAGETALTTATYYKGVATIDGTTQYITLGINEEGLICIYKGYFTWKNTVNNKVPTETFTIAEGTTFRQVYNVNGVWKDTMDNETPNSFTMANGVSLVNVDGCWDIDVETTDLGDLTMTFDYEDGNDNFYFVGKFADETALTSATYYKGVATIDGTTTQYITLGINAEGQICIYKGYFTWKNTANNKVPEKTFEIVAGTTFRQVYHDENGWRDVTDGETPNSFTMASHLSLVCIEDVWDVGPVMGDANGDGVMNTCDLVRYLKYNKDQANTTITTGADIDKDNSYDDIDGLRKLLVGEVVLTETCFSLVRNGKSDYTIVTPANTTENEQVAAEELRYFIKESTGATLSIAKETDSLTANSGKYLYVGDTNAAEEAGMTIASSAQKKNGYLIKTVGDDCYLRGYSDIGTKNSVYEFLDHAFDYEYYAVDEISLTKTSNAKLLNYDLETSPDFEWRMAPNGEVIYTADGQFATSKSGQIANRMRFNLVYDSFVTGYDYHNSYTILPPATYLTEHPEWYSRTATGEAINNGTEPAQLCYSNEEMRTEFTKQLLSKLQSATVENVMLGQQDTKMWCECDDCSTANKKYGTNAAVLVKFANKVQAEVNDWFKVNRPGVTPTRMVIFAYQSTLKPPVRWDVESNSWSAIDDEVILNKDSSVMYAINDMQMHVPFKDTDPESLETPYGRLIGWDACSDSIFAWTYSLYMNHGLLFSNTIDVMTENYKLLKEHGVTMIKEQADAYQKYKNSGFSRLETYLMSKMQWDTSLNQEELIDDFFENYFGEAADTMQELFNLERENIRAKYKDESLGFKGTFGEDVMTKDFWPKSELEAYQALIAEAYVKIADLQTTDATRYAKLYERIQLEAIQFDYIDCSLYSTDIESRNEFKNKFESLGMYSYAEHKTIEMLWKEWGIQYDQIMSYSYISSKDNGDDFNFILHKRAMTGWYQAEAYVDGDLTPVLISVTSATEEATSTNAWIYWHCFNDDASSNTTKQPTATLMICSGTILKPVVKNNWSEQDMSRPSYTMETELYISKSNEEWVAQNMISEKPTSMKMTFKNVSDNDNSGADDFYFTANADIPIGYYKADSVIDGNMQPVLMHVTSSSAGTSNVWIYAGCFNSNGKLSDSVMPQSAFKFELGTVLSPVIENKWTVDLTRKGYQLSSEISITKNNAGTWK